MLAEPIEDCLWHTPDGEPCLEARTPPELEAELGLPAGNIFHRDLAWPYAEADGEAGGWGVETAHPRVLLCGAGARRGGGVSGIPGHNAAMAVPQRPSRSSGLTASGVAPSASVSTTRARTRARHGTPKLACAVVVELRVAHRPPAEALAQAQLQHHRAAVTGGVTRTCTRARPRRVRAVAATARSSTSSCTGGLAAAPAHRAQLRRGVRAQVGAEAAVVLHAGRGHRGEAAALVGLDRDRRTGRRAPSARGRANGRPGRGGLARGVEQQRRARRRRRA